MIAELGHFALILALCLAVAQAIFPLIGAKWGKVTWMQLARPLAYGQCLFLTLAFAALAFAFLTNDFSLTYVAENSNSHLPAIYRFCAVWGAHEGSLLLWVCLLGFWMAAVAAFSRSLPLLTVARVLSVLAMIAVGFLLFLLCTSDPFVRLWPVTIYEGQDLNPLLQDPGLVIHPPILYMGYVGFSVAFAFAIAALMSGRLDAAWARWSKPWTLLAFCFLTAGITLGSWWAYRELGWGGWWFWDPVENASFLPWLVGAALIHSLTLTEKRDACKAWTVLLAIFAFSLSLLGTFLVRSGVLISVHSFAVDPRRGVFMLCFLAIVIGASLLLYAIQIRRVRTVVNFHWSGRESLLLVNYLLLTALMLTILLGTLYPLIIDSLGFEKISVGPPYFNLVFIPFMLCVLFFMAFAPLLRWYDTPLRLLSRAFFIGCITFSLAAVLPWLLANSISLGVVVGLGLAFFILGMTLYTLIQKLFKRVAITRSQWGMLLAHGGIAVCVIGVVLSTHYSVQQEVRMLPGEQILSGPYAFRFLGTRPLVGPNYTGVEGGVLVSQQGQLLTLLKPQQRVYNASKTALSKTAIDAGLFRDLYVALGESLPGNAWSLRIYYKPFVRWIWGGGLFIIFGGLLALTDKRYRLKKSLC